MVEDKKKSLEKKIERVVIKKRIGLWRTHPSFFYVAFFFTVESILSFFVFVSNRTQIDSYSNLFNVLPQNLFALMYLFGGSVVIYALASRKHIVLRPGALILLIPNMMMVTNFLILAFSNGTPGLYIAASKWTLTCLMLILMLVEPFVNPNSAR